MNGLIKTIVVKFTSAYMGLRFNGTANSQGFVLLEEDAMMENILTTLITTVAGGVLVLFFEYFVLKPDAARKRFARAVLLSASLFLPLMIIQFSLVNLFAATMKQQPQSVRIDWFANLYAVVAMLWGWLWGVRIRPELNRRFEKEG